MKRYIFIMLLGLVTFVAKAQDQTTIIVNYLPAISLGETADFTNNFSPRGVDFEANYFLKEDLSVGLLIAWNIFREKVPESTFEIDDLTITGTQFRYTNVTPINVNIKKYWLGNQFSPYVGVGIGTNYAEQINEIGVFSLSQDEWQFNVAPEIGVHYDMNYKSILSFKVKYNYSPEAGDMPATTYISFGVGIGLK